MPNSHTCRGRTDKTRNFKKAGIDFFLLEPFDVVYTEIICYYYLSILPPEVPQF